MGDSPDVVRDIQPNFPLINSYIISLTGVVTFTNLIQTEKNVEEVPSCHSSPKWLPIVRDRVLYIQSNIFVN